MRKIYLTAGLWAMVPHVYSTPQMPLAQSATDKVFIHELFSALSSLGDQFTSGNLTNDRDLAEGLILPEQWEERRKEMELITSQSVWDELSRKNIPLSKFLKDQWLSLRAEHPDDFRDCLIPLINKVRSLSMESLEAYSPVHRGLSEPAGSSEAHPHDNADVLHNQDSSHGFFTKAASKLKRFFSQYNPFSSRDRRAG